MKSTFTSDVVPRLAIVIELLQSLEEMPRRSEAASNTTRWVRLQHLSATGRAAPPETRAIEEFCVGRTYRVTEVTPDGYVGLDVSPDVDRRFGGFMNEIWVEPDSVVEDVPRLNDAMGRPAFADVTHVVHGASAGGLLRRLGAKNVFAALDSLTTGPVSSDPLEHAHLRRRYWREFHRTLPRPPGVKPIRSSFPKNALLSATDFSAVRRRARTRPAVVWIGKSWEERLFFWWTCDALLRAHATNVWIASSGGEYERYDSRGPRVLAYADESQLSHLFAFARRLPKSVIRLGASLWRSFAAGDLGSLAKAHSEPHGPLPRQAALLIPRVVRRAGRVQIHLSEYDHRLLSLFASGEWSTPLGRIRDPATATAYTGLIGAFGDLHIAVRLEQWASVEPRVLESRPADYARTSFEAVEYRLTEHGRRILSEGLRSGVSAPALNVGGFVAYAPTMKWACAVRAKSWEFVPIPRRRLR